MVTLLEMTEGPKDTKVFNAHVARYAGIQGESIEPVPTLYRRDGEAVVIPTKFIESSV